MTSVNARMIIVCTALICVTVLAGIDLLRGGDGATITGAFTVISALVGYEFGRSTTPIPPTTPTP